MKREHDKVVKNAVSDFLAVEQDILKQLHEQLQPYQGRKLWIAYSGGMDSHVLLDAVVKLRNALQSEVIAIHIYHGLQIVAENWVTHCQRQCAELNVPCEVVRVQVNTQRGESLEAQARLARYTALQNLIGEHDIVLTAQHQDDQAETLLLQLVRGAGVAGLAAMATVHSFGKGWLVRPFLNISRQQLQKYAVAQNLQWIEDDSNQDRRFDRNFLRHEIIPQLQQRWSQLNVVLSRVARHQAEAQDLLIELGEQDLTHCQNSEFQQALSIIALKKLSPARQRNALRTWLKRCNILMPSTQHLQEILEMSAAAPDRQPLVHWTDVEIRRYQNCLFVMPTLPPVDNFLSIFWDLTKPLPLPLGRLRAEKVRGHGLKIPESISVNVKLRQGGEMGRWHGHQREIKKLLQQWHIPPWLRAYLPLLYVQDALAAIPNLMICDNFTVAPHEFGWLIHWEGVEKFGGGTISSRAV